MLIGLFTRVKAARMWVDVLESMSKGKYSESIDMLDKFDGLISHHEAGQITEGYLHSQLLRVAALLNLSRYAEMLSILTVIQQYLRSYPQPSAKIKYLTSYGAVLGQTALQRRPNLSHDYPELDLQQLFSEDFDQVDLKMVPARLKRKFPLPYHPNWVEP